MRVVPLIRPRSCGVYFVAGAGLVKIGYALDIPRRVADMQSGSPVPLRLVHQVVTHRRVRHPVEGLLHARFASNRVHGEWFDLPADWRDDVAEVLAPLVIDGHCNGWVAENPCRRWVSEGSLWCSSHWRTTT